MATTKLEKLAVSALHLSTGQWNGRANFVVGVTLSVGAFARLTTSQIDPHAPDAAEYPRGSAGRNSCPGAHLRSVWPSTETNDRSAGRANGEKQRQKRDRDRISPGDRGFPFSEAWTGRN
jgi:hypothetical protein